MLAALRSFGAPLLDVTRDDLTRADTAIQIGLPPSRIDVLSGSSGLTFDDAWKNRIEIAIDDLTVPIIGRDDFITNTRASGRPKDLSDLALLPPAVNDERGTRNDE